MAVALTVFSLHEHDASFGTQQTRSKLTRRSLCIIDEFGKGTLSTDGIGLLCASLRHFAAQQPAPPKVIACTHFSEALNPCYLPRCLCRFL